MLLAKDGTITEANARMFAASVSRAMFHQDMDGVGPGGGSSGSKSKDVKKGMGKRNVQPTLALAFLIRKRGEYAVTLASAAMGGSGSNRARDSTLFLPSTKEIMEWKGMNF